MRRTTLAPEIGGGKDKSPATPAANDSVLSANAAATTRMSGETAKVQVLAESRPRVTQG
jgi:hypothetical protein